MLSRPHSHESSTTTKKEELINYTPRLKQPPLLTLRIPGISICTYRALIRHSTGAATIPQHTQSRYKSKLVQLQPMWVAVFLDQIMAFSPSPLFTRVQRGGRLIRSRCVCVCNSAAAAPLRDYVREPRAALGKRERSDLWSPAIGSLRE